MRIVVDTNVLLAVACDEPDKPVLVEAAAGHELLAPSVLPFEVGNALSALFRRGILSRDEAVRAWDAVQAIPVGLCEIDVRAALELAADRRIYAYDAYFLECSLKWRAPLLTLDRKLKSVAEAVGVNIVE